MGGNKQVATMVLKVDLECHRCYKKIKKVLCSIPQIQDQVYDEKANTVTIKVVCCSPEKIRDKIKCKGGDSVKGIEIKVPKPPEPEKPKPPPPIIKEPQKPAPKEPPPKPKDLPPKPEAEKPKDPPPKPKDPPPEPKEPEKPKPAAPAPAPVPVPVPVPVPIGYPPVGAYQFGSCCPDCREGRPGGPCFYGCVPPGPPLCYQYDGYSGRPVYDSYGGGRSYYCEENSAGCAIM